MGRKLGGGAQAVPPFLGGVGSPSNTKSPGPRPTSIPSGILIHLAAWPQWTWAENWGLCPFLGSWLPHLTQWGLGRRLPPRPVSFWSIQLFGHNTPTSQTDRQTEQDRINRTEQRSDSTGQTVLQSPRNWHSKMYYDCKAPSLDKVLHISHVQDRLSTCLAMVCLSDQPTIFLLYWLRNAQLVTSVWLRIINVFM